jgi:hypothetical protein
MIHRALRNQQQDTTVFFQVPDMLRILKETAFWDIYYEHCSYFSLGSLARLFRRCGFAVTALAREYDGQYLTITARPAVNDRPGVAFEQEDDLVELSVLVEQFAKNFARLRQQWRARLDEYLRAKRRVVVWGSGSKGVAFLTTLGANSGIDYVVDINPRRQGFFMAGTGQEIVSPAFLQRYQPDVVIIMNPIYQTEVIAELERLHLSPEVLTT